MKERKPIRRWILTALCLCALALLPCAARAANATSVFLHGRELNAANPYYVNGADGAQGTVYAAEPASWNAFFDAANGTLYINNLNVKNGSDTLSDFGVTALYASDDLTLDISGINTLTTADAPANTNNYALTARTNTGQGALTARGDGMLLITAGSASDTDGTSRGLFTRNLTVSGNCRIESAGGRAFRSVGITMNQCTVSDNAQIKGTGNGTDFSVGINLPSRNNSITLSDNGLIEGRGNEASTQSYGISIPNGPITISGGTLIASSGSSGTMGFGALVPQPTFASGLVYAWRTKDSGDYLRSDKAAYQWASDQTYVEICPKDIISYATSATANSDTFDPRTEGYQTSPTLTVTIQNDGNSPVHPTILHIGSYSGWLFYPPANWTDALAGGETRSITVQPNPGLIAREYGPTFNIPTDEGSSANISLSFTVNPALSASVSPDPIPAIIAGERVTLTASATGGTGLYSYQWSGGIADTTQIITVSPTTDTTYTVAISDQGEGSATASAAVTVTPQNIGISLDPAADKDFGATIKGYGAQTAHTVTVENVGNQPTGDLSVALSKADAGSFTLSKTAMSSLAVGGSDTFTVVPNIGLDVKTYTATVTVSGGNGITARSFNVRFTVNRAPSDPPATENVVSGITPDQSIAQGASITFTAIGGGMDNQTPRAGDLRWCPSKWQSGTLNGNFDTGYTQTFSAALLSVGTHTLSVTYMKQRYDGANWVNVRPTVTDVKNVRFTVFAVPVTGDFNQPMIWIALLMIGGMGVLTMIQFIKRRRQSTESRK